MALLCGVTVPCTMIWGRKIILTGAPIQNPYMNVFRRQTSFIFRIAGTFQTLNSPNALPSFLSIEQLDICNRPVLNGQLLAVTQSVALLGDQTY